MLADYCKVSLIKSLGRPLGFFREKFEVSPAFSLAPKNAW